MQPAIAAKSERFNGKRKSLLAETIEGDLETLSRELEQIVPRLRRAMNALNA